MPYDTPTQEAMEKMKVVSTEMTMIVEDIAEEIGELIAYAQDPLVVNNALFSIDRALLKLEAYALSLRAIYSGEPRPPLTSRWGPL